MKRALFLVACVFATVLPASPAPAANFPTRTSPAGQIHVVSANAWQRKVIGVKRFEMMLELARAMLKRPVAFDGGGQEAAAAPDIIVMQEMQAANLEIFANLLRQRSNVDYQIVGSTTAFGKFIINTETIGMQGEAHVWNDVCYEAATNDEGETLQRNYQWGEFIELETGTRFTASSIHFDPRYTRNTGQHGCFEKNIPEIRRQMDMTDVPAIIAGDFNRRAVQMTHECDPEEESEPLAWYSMITAPESGRVYVDSVKDFHRRRGLTMETEWTHEQKARSVTCDTSTRHRRNRIDYLFTSGMEIASAHADHPGWAGEEPGTRHPTNKKYSDHRFLAGRFQLVGPATPARPTVESAARGVQKVAWQPIDDPTITEWILFRAIGQNAFSPLTRLSADTLTYNDFATEHGKRYRYSVAAVDSGGLQGIESRPRAGWADARGPQVKTTSPWANATRIERRPKIIARFDEAFDKSSVSSGTMKLFRNGKRICGRTTVLTRRFIQLKPCNKLGKKKTYTVNVASVLDKLGNRGSFHSWRFTTR